MSQWESNRISQNLNLQWAIHNMSVNHFLNKQNENLKFQKNPFSMANYEL